MKATTCPFCGVVTETPHDTQEGCITALQLEIARVRHILELSQPAGNPAPLSVDPDDTEPS